MNIAAWLDKNGRSFPGRPGISLGESVYASFAVWAGRSRRIAGRLRGALGLRPGDRAAIVMNNRPEYLEAIFAIWHAGLVAVPVNARLHRNEFEYILGHSGSRLVFASPDLAETLGPLVG